MEPNGRTPLPNAQHPRVTAKQTTRESDPLKTYIEDHDDEEGIIGSFLEHYPGILTFKCPSIESTYQASKRATSGHFALLFLVVLGIVNTTLNLIETPSECGKSAWRCDWKFTIMGFGSLVVDGLFCAFLLSVLHSTRGHIQSEDAFVLRHYQRLLSTLAVASFIWYETGSHLIHRLSLTFPEDDQYPSEWESLMIHVISTPHLVPLVAHSRTAMLTPFT
eukprot:6885123-Pyramimonas_sp.AAC.1